MGPLEDRIAFTQIRTVSLLTGISIAYMLAVQSLKIWHFENLHALLWFCAPSKQKL